MTSPIVEQLRHGVKVRCADGFETTCKPLTLDKAITFLDLDDAQRNPRITQLVAMLAAKPAPTADQEAALQKELDVLLLIASQSRTKTVRLFFEQYPDLAPHIAAGDVEGLLLDFFWSATGSAVVRNGAAASPRTGTAPSDATSPPTASSPT